MPAKPETASREFIDWFKHELTQLTQLTRAIVKSGEEHIPIMFIFPADATLPVQMVPIGQFFQSNSGKDIIASLHKEIATDPQVKACLLVNEVWTLAMDAKASVNMKKSLENEPGREEAILFNCIKGGMQLIAVYRITRPGNTLPKEPTRLLDPTRGIIEEDGKPVDHTFGIGGAVGRMVIEPDKH